MSASVVAMILGAALVAVIGYIAVKYVRIILNIFLGVLTVSPPRPHKLGGEPVTFRSLDGLLLYGVFLAARGRARGTVVFCHEFGADGASVADFALFLRDRFNLFTFDFRGHGRSAHARHHRPCQWPSTREVDDVLGAVAYVAGRSDAGALPVGLFGVSRGGSAALCAGARCAAVRAVVADSACSTRLIMQAYMRRWVGIYSNLEVIYRNLPDAVYTAVRVLAMLVAQVRLRCLFPSVLRAIARIGPRPVFLIHGERDVYIDQSQAEALFNRAREPKRLWIVPGARHNRSVVHAAEAYRARVTEFFAAALTPPAGREPVAEGHPVPLPEA